MGRTDGRRPTDDFSRRESDEPAEEGAQTKDRYVLCHGSASMHHRVLTHKNAAAAAADGPHHQSRKQQHSTPPPDKTGSVRSGQ